MGRLPLFIIALTLSAAAPAALYKWVDKDGNVTYSERRPPGVEAQEINVRGAPAVSNEQARERLDAIRDQSETARKDREFKESYGEESAEREERLKRNCETARENLRILQTAARVKDAEGNFMDDEARQARLEQTQQEIADNCP
jgi:hypothetical protein